MTPVNIGNASLAAAAVAASASVVLALMSVRYRSAALLSASRWTNALFAGGIAVCAWALLRSLMTNDFNVDYVARYTERALPAGYKIAAFWAGQEGSLLLWALLLAIFGFLYCIVTRRQTDASAGFSTAALSFVSAFFALLMVFAANPMKLIDVAPADGQGLNPMLQDPGMIAHPPLLFLGYAGFTVPFAMMIGALLAGRRDNDWVLATRRWTLISWAFLSVGILLGAQWAYVELGWGGYWAWDPVENASLLPWLTGTALLHSIMVQQHRGMLKGWSVSLMAATFVLCIFGTYITRSGVIDSVHAFGKSLIGTFFLIFLGVSVVASIVVIVARRKLLASERQLESLLSREGLFLATNVLLSLMTAVVLVGTIFPLISDVILGRKITVQQSFYNTVISPMAVLLVAIMALGPLMSYGQEGAQRLLKLMIVPLVGGVLAALALVTQNVTNVWALLTAAIIGTAACSIVLGIALATIARCRTQGENPLLALLRTIDSNHRRYGGQIVHIGMLMIVVGIVGSSLFGVKETFQLHRGESATFAGRKIQLVDIKENRHENYTSVEAGVKLTDPRGVTIDLLPERRFYDKSENANSEVALQMTLREDVYLTLAGWEDDGSVVALQVLINPLVSWIWIGGIVLTCGALIGLTPRLLPRGHEEAKETPAPAAARPVRLKVSASTH